MGRPELTESRRCCAPLQPGEILRTLASDRFVTGVTWADGDLELLAESQMPGARPEGWSGMAEPLNPELGLLTRLDLELLYGSLVEAGVFLEHDERVPGWDARFKEALAELEQARDRERFNASLKPARLPVTF